MSPKDNDKLQTIVEDLGRKQVKDSIIPCAVPTLLVPKKDGSYKICIDSRVINKIIVKYHFPILRLEDMLDKLMGSHFFLNCTKSRYHHIIIHPGDEWKTTFKTI